MASGWMKMLEHGWHNAIRAMGGVFKTLLDVGYDFCFGDWLVIIGMIDRAHWWKNRPKCALFVFCELEIAGRDQSRKIPMRSR